MITAPSASRVVACLTVCAATLRFSSLDLQSFGEDEAVTALLVRLPFGEMLATLPRTESTPPLYYVMAWLWAQLSGTGEVGLRSLSALVGTLAVPATYSAGSCLLSRRAGLGAAALVAVSPALVTYSQEARSYALLVTLATLALALFAHVHSRYDGTLLVVWGLVSALALATHYFALFVVAPQAILLLWKHRTRQVAGAVASLAVVCLVLLPLALTQREHGLSANLTAGDPLSSRVVIVVKQLLAGAQSPLDREAAVLMAVVVATAAAVILSRAHGPMREGVSLATTIGVCAVALPTALAMGGLDYVLPRNALIAIPPLAIAGSAAVAVSSSRASSLALGGICVLLVWVHVATLRDAASHRPDWRGLGRTLGSSDEPRLVVVAPNLDGWSARPVLSVYVPDAAGIDGVLNREAAAFEDLLPRETELPPRLVVVREIAVAAVRWSMPLTDDDLPDGFWLATRQDSQRYRIAIYRSNRPVAVDPVAVSSRLRTAAAVLLQSATPSS